MYQKWLQQEKNSDACGRLFLVQLSLILLALRMEESVVCLHSTFAKMTLQKKMLTRFKHLDFIVLCFPEEIFQRAFP